MGSIEIHYSIEDPQKIVYTTKPIRCEEIEVYRGCISKH